MSLVCVIQPTTDKKQHNILLYFIYYIINLSIVIDHEPDELFSDWLSIQYNKRVEY